MKAKLALVAIAAATMGAGRGPLDVSSLNPTPAQRRRRPGLSPCCGARTFRAGLPDPSCSKCGKVVKA